MRALTTKKERAVKMDQLRNVSKTEKIIFPILVTIIVSLLLPDAASLVGMLMLGNLFKESGVVDRLSKTAQNELMNIIVIFLGLTVGATTTGSTFLTVSTLKIIAMGLCAFAIGTAGGVLFGKLMYVVTKGKVNPLIGSAGVSAVPMAARVSQKVGREENPQQLSAYARYGSKRFRRYRIGSCSRRSSEAFRLIAAQFTVITNPGGNTSVSTGVFDVAAY